MLFVDGVGIGRRDAAVNPLLPARLPALRSLSGGELPTLGGRHAASSRGAVFPLDATLGVAGLPQSGTGQTALFTGVNAARIVGRHFGPYPYSTLRPVITEQNIFRRLIMRGLRPCFANAYPDRFFRYIEQHESRLTVTTRASLESAMPLRTAEDLRHGRAVSADITGEGWARLGHPSIAAIAEREAGRRLVSLLGEHDFVLFEYWHTDRAGHARNPAQAVEVLERFDRMLEGVLESIDLRSALLLITSDHGNIEDLSVKTHTRHPVPLWVAGLRHAQLMGEIQDRPRPDLTHVTPALLNLFH
jgi:2,3-bisphosphoglycerate-independent phosphoglycerate mutase